jgi:hypothetical protein
VTIRAFGVQLFRSAGLARPVLIGVLLFALARETRAALWVATTLVVLFAAPVSDYFLVHAEITSIRRPLRAIRDCVVNTIGVGKGVYVPDPMAVPHPQYYYFRALGPWAEGPANREQELAQRLFAPGRETLVLMSKRDIVKPPTLAGGLGPTGTGPGRPVHGRSETLKGIEAIAAVIVWLPGPYAACAAPAAAAGGIPAVTNLASASGTPHPVRPR